MAQRVVWSPRALADELKGLAPELARDHNGLHVPCPDDILMPRLALGALVVG